MNPELIRRIVLPTDLSDFSKAAARWAMMFHSRFGSQITLLFANQPYIPIDVIGGPAAYSPQYFSDLEYGIAEELRRFASDCLGDASSVDTRIIDAAPADGIIRTANEIDADLILMGTHGRRGWRRALLGSVTEHVLRSTTRPLMSVPAFLGAVHTPAISKILCPVNFTEVGRLALDEAARLAEAFSAELVVVHVVELADEPFMKHLEREFAAWVEPNIRSRSTYRQLLIRGDAAELILQNSDDIGADLIVLGAQHRRFRDATVIGTTTERIVRFAHQPVWTVVSPVEHFREEQQKYSTSVSAG